jgi:TetR/AcrR family transcriptional repressor of mexJK operon
MGGSIIDTPRRHPATSITDLANTKARRMPKSLRSGTGALPPESAPEAAGTAATRSAEHARPDKHHAITRAAAETFLAEGFERASLDQIAQRAGVSKQTIYSHFADKEALFKAICAELTETLTFPLQRSATSLDLRHTLVRLGEDTLALTLRPEALDLHRLVASAAPRFPELGRVAWEGGARRMLSDVATLLVERSQIGDGLSRPLEAAEAEILAEQFVGMLRGFHQARGLLGVAAMPATERKAYILSCVELILRAA